MTPTDPTPTPRPPLLDEQRLRARIEALDAAWLAVWTSRFKFRDGAATGPDTFYAGIVHAANIIGSPETRALRAEPGTAVATEGGER
jgi:hypothetical protein